MARKKLELKIKKLNEQAVVPQYMSKGAAGMDICSCERVFIKPNARVLVKTGISMAIPEGYEVQVRPRSGLAAKYGITVVNSPGTIDSDYRGEIGVILLNTGGTEFKVKVGDRIAQLVVQKVEQPVVTEVQELDETDRGEAGFGSTGTA